MPYSRALTPNKTRSFQQYIGLMLASYTRAINKRNNWSGSLFRKQTKAICPSCNENNARVVNDKKILQKGLVKHFNKTVIFFDKEFFSRPETERLKNIGTAVFPH